MTRRLSETSQHRDLAPHKRIRWAQSYRVVNARFPPIAAFERLADPADWEALFEIEMLTNPRLRDEVGEIALVANDERVAGPGASWVMAPFTHIGWPSRFSDGTWGVYYAARQLLTAVYEKSYHVGRFYASTNEPRGTTMELRALVAKIDARFHDVRGGFAALHDPNDYTAGQAFSAKLRERNSNGIVYDSVRHPGGVCLAAFRPKAVQRPISGPHVRVHWDGARIDRWFHFGDKRWASL